MILHVYTIVRNEEYMLPYFLRHYETIADKIFIIDDHSTDRTEEVAKSHPMVTFMRFPHEGLYDEKEHNEYVQEAYKKHSRGIADWVICVDADEIIYGQDVRGKLERRKRWKYKILRATGYDMMSERVPTTPGQIYYECQYGVRLRGYDKPVIFQPDIDIVFGNGKHHIEPIPGIKPMKAGLLLMHFRYLSLEYFLNRSMHQYIRLGMPRREREYRLAKGLSSFYSGIQNRIKII